MMRKAGELPADEIMLDLEDGVALEEKEEAREKIIRFLKDYEESMVWILLLLIEISLRLLSRRERVLMSWLSLKWKRLLTCSL